MAQPATWRGIWGTDSRAHLSTSCSRWIRFGSGRLGLPYTGLCGVGHRGLSGARGSPPSASGRPDDHIGAEDVML